MALVENSRINHPKNYFMSKINNLRNKIIEKKKEINENINKHNDVFKNSYIKDIIPISEKVQRILQRNPSVKICVEDVVYEISIDKLDIEKESIFYKIVISSKYKDGMELFFDRPKLFFEDILKWLRYGYLDLTKYNYNQLCHILREAEYYSLINLANNIKMLMAPLQVVDIKITSEVELSNKKKYGINSDIENKPKTISVFSQKEIEFELNQCWPKISLKITPAYSIFSVEKDLKNANEKMKIFTSSNKQLWIEQVQLATHVSQTEVILNNVKYVRFLSSNDKPIGFTNIEFIKKI